MITVDSDYWNIVDETTKQTVKDTQRHSDVKTRSGRHPGSGDSSIKSTSSTPRHAVGQRGPRRVEVKQDQIDRPGINLQLWRTIILSSSSFHFWCSHSIFDLSSTGFINLIFFCFISSLFDGCWPPSFLPPFQSSFLLPFITVSTRLLATSVLRLSVLTLHQPRPFFSLSWIPPVPPPRFTCP